MREIIKIIGAIEDQIDVSDIPKGTSFDVQTVLNWVYGVMGIAAVVFIIYGAVKYLMAQGDPGQIKQGSQAMAFALIGLAIILLAAAVTNFVFNSIGSAG